MHVQQMRTLLNDRDQKKALDRLSKVRPDSQRRWGSMSAHQMICHLSDSFRVALGEKHVSSSSTLFKRTIYKWAALWVPFRWPHGVKTCSGWALCSELSEHCGSFPVSVSSRTDGNAHHARGHNPRGSLDSCASFSAEDVVCSTWNGLHRTYPHARCGVRVCALGSGSLDQTVSSHARPGVWDGVLRYARGVWRHAAACR